VTLQRITPPTLDDSNYDAALRIAPGTSPEQSFNNRSSEFSNGSFSWSG